MADRNTPVTMTMEQWRVEFNELAVDVGDIAIGFEIINKRSAISNFNYEFDKMWIHGFLHLVGYDHKKDKDYKLMKKKEKLILNYLNN